MRKRINCLNSLSG